MSNVLSFKFYGLQQKEYYVRETSVSTKFKILEILSLICSPTH